jgi:hypothetical protein
MSKWMNQTNEIKQNPKKAKTLDLKNVKKMISIDIINAIKSNILRIPIQLFN